MVKKCRTTLTHSVDKLGLPELVLFHVVAERPKAHAQEFGGLVLAPTGLRQGLRDVSALDRLDVLPQVEASRRQRVGRHSVGVEDRRRFPPPSIVHRCWTEVEALGLDDIALFEGHRPLDDVFELAHVTRGQE